MRPATFLLLGIFQFAFLVLSAQDTTNRGIDFWVGYGHHQFMETGANNQEMILYLSAGSQAANVTVSVDSTGYVVNYVIPANTVIVTNPIPKTGSFDARLFNDPPPIGTGSIGLFSKKGIRVESNVPIAVYSHIYGSASSGASMLLPIHAWGYTYYGVNNAQQYASNCYSWMYIVAREDSTVVEITPSVKTKGQNYTGLQPGVATTIVLNKGNIYQLMGANTSSDGNGNGGTAATGYELTGTKVRALIPGKPVAVFSGSSRTSGPAICGSGGGDNEMVQLFPIHIWGTKYLAAPLAGSTGASSVSTSTYKIVVNDPLTVVKRNGVVSTGLINSSFYQYESNTADYIEADNPIMVAQFMNGGSGCLPGGLGDPDMYYLSPMDGGVKHVTTMRSNKENITINYMTLIVPTNALASLQLTDGGSPQALDHVYPHPNYPNRSVAVKRWNAAISQVSISCDSAIVGLTYGIGAVESYGFNIGAKFTPIHGLDPMYRQRWTGNSNTDWYNGNNWSTGLVPSANEHVLVPAGTANNLVVPDGVEVKIRSLELAPGATMTVRPNGKVILGDRKLE